MIACIVLDTALAAAIIRIVLGSFISLSCLPGLINFSHDQRLTPAAEQGQEEVGPYGFWLAGPF
jgi:hypothetical protein